MCCLYHMSKPHMSMGVFLDFCLSHSFICSFFTHLYTIAPLFSTPVAPVCPASFFSQILLVILRVWECQVVLQKIPLRSFLGLCWIYRSVCGKLQYRSFPFKNMYLLVYLGLFLCILVKVCHFLHGSCWWEHISLLHQLFSPFSNKNF